MTGCTDDADGSSKSPAKSHAEPTKTRPTHDEQKLGKQVKEALGTQAIDDSDPLFVESGLERISDGIHTQPKLSPGTRYELKVACAGKGKIELSIEGGKPGHQTVGCDGVPATHRTSGSRSKLQIDTTAGPGAVGMVGWRISKIEK
ncbi:hypothetical protein ACFWPU_45635 [Streptomyces sp. NPDC058471]|uniref:hypothetical protein n=1 Tax=Streptomyces sp. NPDC058471 TaxID=3346516 RepID=UPI003666F68E